MEVVNNDKLTIKKLQIEIEKTGHITNTYFIVDNETNNCIVIDPAFNADLIKEEINKLRANLMYVIITHAHADHIAALADLVNATNIKVYINKDDFYGLYDKDINQEEIVQTKVNKVDKTNIITVDDGDVLMLGNIKFEFVHTPGHTKGSMIIYNKEFDIIFSGDTIFENTYGRTDLLTGSHDDMKRSLDKIFEKYENSLVLPGHGNEFYINNSRRRIRLLFAYKG